MMPRTTKQSVTSEAQRRSAQKYKANNTRQLSLNLSLQYDADILAQLDAIPNKQGYIKGLIRADIAQKGPAQKEEEKPMLYHIKSDYLTMWGSDCTEETVIDQTELERLAAEWEKPVEELLEQLTPID